MPCGWGQFAKSTAKRGLVQLVSHLRVARAFAMPGRPGNAEVGTGLPENGFDPAAEPPSLLQSDGAEAHGVEYQEVLSTTNIAIDICTILWYISRVKVSLEKVESLCRKRGTSIGTMLREAGVSRNAFYTLARKDAVVPRSLIRISERLGVSVSALLDDVLTPTQRMKRLADKSDRISERHRGVDRDNIRHTLLLLEEKPIERLRRALRRGRPVNLRR